MVTTDTQLELLAEQEHIKPSDHLTYFGHLSGLKGFLRRNPNAQDLTGLLSAIESKTPGGIGITQFSVTLYANDEKSELITSQQGLERYIASSGELAKSSISSDLPNNEFVRFACNDLPCEGSIYSERAIDGNIIKSAARLVPGCVMFVGGYAATVGSLAGLAHPDTSWLAIPGAPTAAVLFSVSIPYFSNISRFSMNLDLFYTGPEEKKSPERMAYAGLVHNMQQFKL